MTADHIESIIFYKALSEFNSVGILSQNRKLLVVPEVIFGQPALTKFSSGEVRFGEFQILCLVVGYFRNWSEPEAARIRLRIFEVRKFSLNFVVALVLCKFSDNVRVTADIEYNM